MSIILRDDNENKYILNWNIDSSQLELLQWGLTAWNPTAQQYDMYLENTTIIGSGGGGSGTSGTSGTSGSNGSSGTSGTTGTSGSTGTSGTSGTSCQNGISSGQIYYFNQSQSAGINSYKVLDIMPSTASQQVVTTNLTSSEQGKLVSSFITPQLGFGVIPNGVQRFHAHFLKQASNDSIQFYIQIQLANSSGVAIGPTLSTGNSEIGWVDASTPVEVTVDLTLPTTTIDPTNRMIARIYLSNNDNNTHQVDWYTEGTSYYSFVVTSVGVIGSTSGTSGTSGTSATNNEIVINSMLLYLSNNT